MKINRVGEGDFEIVLEPIEVQAAVREYIVKRFEPPNPCALSLDIFPHENPILKIALVWYGRPRKNYPAL